MSRRTNIFVTFLFITILAVVSAVIDNPNGPDIDLSGIKIEYQKELKAHLGLDLQGGTHLVYEADLSNVQPEDYETSMDGLKEVIERRVNALGVSEPVVQTVRSGGNYKLVVELAGVTDPREAIDQIGQTPLLEFHELPQQEESKPDANQEGIEQPSSDAPAEIPSSDTNASPEEDTQSFNFFLSTAYAQEPAPEESSENQTSSEGVPSGEGTSDNGSEQIELDPTNGAQELQPEAFQPQFVPTKLSGRHIKNAEVAFDPQTNEPMVTIDFNDEGKQLFAEITERNVQKPVAILLDGAIISAPIVQQPITGGTAQITGNFSLEEAKDLAQRLRTGALPVPINLISQNTVGPSLGKVSVEDSLLAGMIGLIIVALFMILYYRLPGILAVGALGIYILIVIALFKLIPVVLTLAGIAGFILSIGMAVDANVLIFERMKEELANGKNIRLAIEDGFKHAWTSIRDSNISTLLTCLVLAWFGSSIIRGFAITLSIGIIISMFSAIVVTRTFLRIFSGRRIRKHLWLFGPRLNSLMAPKQSSSKQQP